MFYLVKGIYQEITAVFKTVALRRKKSIEKMVFSFDLLKSSDNLELLTLPTRLNLSLTSVKS